MQAHSKCTHTTPVLPDYFLSFQCLVVFPAISKLAWHNSILVRSILHNIGVVLWSNAVRLSVFPSRCVSIVWQLTLVSVAQVSPSPYYFSCTGRSSIPELRTLLSNEQTHGILTQLNSACLHQQLIEMNQSESPIWWEARRSLLQP